MFKSQVLTYVKSQSVYVGAQTQHVERYVRLNVVYPASQSTDKHVYQRKTELAMRNIFTYDEKLGNQIPALAMFAFLFMISSMFLFVISVLYRATCKVLLIYIEYKFIIVVKGHYSKEFSGVWPSITNTEIMNIKRNYFVVSRRCGSLYIYWYVPTQSIASNYIEHNAILHRIESFSGTSI